MSDQERNNVDNFQKQIKEKIIDRKNAPLLIHRSKVFDDSYESLSNREPISFLGRMNIQFDNEQGIDVGSLTKEWIVLLMRDIVTKFFTCSPQYYYYPSTYTSEMPNFQSYFEFSGKIFALALIYDTSINVNFSTFFLKHILRLPIDFEDVKNYDESVYQSLSYLRDNDANGLDLYFETSQKSPNGELINVELIPNGSKVKVTNENKKEYIDALVNYLLTKSIQPQVDAFCKGFDSLIQHNEIENITIKDLEYLISGPRQIDVKDFISRIKTIVYNSDDSQVVKLFFDAISKWSNDDLKKLLIFVTCC